MGEAPRIGIYFTYGENWLGGVYYLVNLVNSFNYRLDGSERLPTFVIFHTKESAEYIKLFTYKHIEFVEVEVPKQLSSYATSWLSRANRFLLPQFEEYKIDGIYPINDLPVRTRKKYKIIAWYPDLQHKFYPEYFTKSNLLLRERRVKLILKNCDKLVVSSQDVYNHFKQFYKIDHTEVAVVPFVSLIEKSSLLDREGLLKKYKIDGPYFMVSNQFYRHKDHSTVFQAIHELKEQGRPPKVLMTGKLADYRNANYINELKQTIKDLSLEPHIHLLGVIPRLEQLSLLKYATAIIQPSLFEGWSTLVEDAKSLGASIIASDIEVHKEQLDTYGKLFKHGDPTSLANAIQAVTDNPNLAATSFDYTSHIKQFTNSFENLFL